MSNEKIGVLLADDDASFLEGLRSLLEANGFDVIGRAGDGAEAASLAARLRPAVAILDISMPRLNGIEAARRICAASPWSRILMLSAHVSPSYLESALHAGAHGYVVKDSVRRELIGALRAILAGERYVSDSLKG